MQKIINELNNTLSSSEISTDESMAKHTSFKAGGTCDIMIKVGSIDDIKNAIKILKENSLPYLVLGRGSNVLFTDEAYRGAVLKLSDDFADVNIIEKNDHSYIIKAQAGIKLKKLAEFCLDKELCGLEFAHGIPGTLGGAITMNAGAYGGEMKDIVRSVTILNEKLEIVNLNCEDMNFGYRKSIIQREKYIVLESTLELQKEKKAEIESKMKDYMQRRLDSQPLNYASAGSTFKRPEGYFAGKLIQDANLKGVKYKNAMVSDKHAGFIVNTGKAKANEIIELIEFVEKTVYDIHGVKLEKEVKII